MMTVLKIPENVFKNQPSKEDLTSKRILIIEDEMMMSFMLDDMVTALGYEVAGIAPHVEEASEQIEHQSFDAAILDVNLGGKDTFGLADQLQEKNLPFLFSTGYDPESLPDRYRNCPTLQKPYSMTQLGSRLKTLLSKAS